MSSKTNTKQLEQLKKAYANNRLAQAYLFSGPQGVGKSNTVFDFLNLIDERIRQEDVWGGSDPDIVIVKPEIEHKGQKKRKKDISIVQIKKAISKVGFFPYKSRYKFLIIFEAERMNIAASNSLLKLIEEPSPDTMILLVTNDEQKILPTIRSRCQFKRFGLVDSEVLRSKLRKQYPDADKRDLKLAVELSKGRSGLAENYLNDPQSAIDLKEQIEKFRKALRGGIVSGLELSREFSEDKEELLSITNEWIWYLRDFLKDLIASGGSKEIAKKVFMILNLLIETRDKIENTNVNQKVQLDNFFIQIN